jgi:hypothetical protein
VPIGRLEVKFRTGDLVKFKPSSTIYGVVVSDLNLGIIVNEAILMYVHDFGQEDSIKQYWSYDVLIDGETYRNVPEEVLEKIENDNEKDS